MTPKVLCTVSWGGHRLVGGDPWLWLIRPCHGMHLDKAAEGEHKPLLDVFVDGATQEQHLFGLRTLQWSLGPDDMRGEVKRTAVNPLTLVKLIAITAITMWPGLMSFLLAAGFSKRADTRLTRSSAV